MKRASYLLFSLLLACASPLWGQQLQAAKSFPSSPDRAVGVVLTDSAGGWLVFAVPSMVPVQAEPINSGCGIVWEGQPGRYLVLYFPAGQSFPQPEVITRDLGIVGPVEPPPVDPSDPTTPDLSAMTGPAYLIVLRKSEQLTADQAKVLAKLRSWADSQPSKTNLLEFSPDADDSRVQSYVAKMPSDAELPYVFLGRAKKSDGKAGVIWKGKLPSSEQEIIDRVGGLKL